jgi:hypothetical protein
MPQAAEKLLASEPLHHSRNFVMRAGRVRLLLVLMLLSLGLLYSAFTAFLGV